MSVVSNPTHLNGSLLGSQLVSPSTGHLSDGGAHCLESGDMQSLPAKLATDNEALVNNNCHINTSSDTVSHQEATETAVSDEHVEDDSPVIDIIINNVVCTFGTKCYLNLKKIAMEGAHVEYRRENGMLNMKLRRPQTTATIWSSGKITCTGSTSEDEAKKAARRIARRLQRLGFKVRFSNYRVVNVLGTCGLPFGIKLNQFSEANRTCASYEPELHPGVTYRIKEPKATLKIFSTGSITVTAPSVLNVQLAIQHIYPLVLQHKMDTKRIDDKVLKAERKYLRKSGTFVGYPVLRLADDDEDDDEFDDGIDEEDDDDLSDDFDSDESHD